MTIRIPTEADKNTRDAFQDVENRLRKLEQKPSAPVQTTVVTEDRPYEDTELLKSAVFDGDVRIENNLDAYGNISIPHLFDGLIKPIPEGEAGTSEAQRVINIGGSVVIAPGGLSADSVHVRDLQLKDRYNFFRPGPTVVVYQDDFLHSSDETGEIGILNWGVGGDAGYSFALSGGNVGHPGLLAMKPDNDTGDSVYLFSNPTNYGMLNGIEEYWQTWVIKDNNNLGETNTIIGINTTIDYAAGTDGIYFFADQTADANWQARTRSASTSTDTDTGVAIAASWIRLDVHYTPNEVTFYINGVLVATHTTNIPETNNMQPVYAVTTDATGNGQALSNAFIDYYSLAYQVAR